MIKMMAVKAFIVLTVSAAASNEWEPHLAKNGTTGVQNKSHASQRLDFQ